MMQMQQQQHQGPPAPPQNVQQGHFNPAQQIASMNEAVWLQIGTLQSKKNLGIASHIG